MSISRNNARRVFVLEVKGLSARYYSGPTPSTMSTHIDSASEIAFTLWGGWQSIAPSL